MSSLVMKPLDIRLTDIWVDCQREMHSMRHELTSLRQQLKTSKLISSHLIVCNETLVAIIETSRLDPKAKEIIVLIDRIKREEEVIDREKSNLKTLEARDESHYNCNDDKIVELMSDWKRLTQTKRSVKDKSTQTMTTDGNIGHKEIPFDGNIENIVSNESLRQTSVAVTESTSGEPLDAINSDIKRVAIDLDDKQYSDYESESPFNAEDINDYNIDDNRSVVSVKCGDVKNEDTNDTDIKPKKKRNRSKSRRRETNTTQVMNEPEKSERQKRIDALVLPLKQDNHYICDEIECDFKTTTKRDMFSHKNGHKTGNQSLIEKRVRKEDLFLHLKVDNEYVCDEMGCDYRTTIKRDIGRHKNRHKSSAHELNPFDELRLKDKLEKRKRINERVSHLKVNNEYICDDMGCDFKTTIKRVIYRHMNGHKSVAYDGQDLCDEEDDEEVFELQKQINEMVLHLKTDNEFVCDYMDCHFRTCIKREIYKHMIGHNSTKSGDRRVTEQQKRIDALVLHLKRDKHYICDQMGCVYKTTFKRNMFQHTIGHKKSAGFRPKDFKPKIPDERTPKERAEDNKRIENLMREFLEDGKYVCNEDDCDFLSTKATKFYKHYKRHQMWAKGRNPIYMDESAGMYKLRTEATIDGNYECYYFGCKFTTTHRQVFYVHYKSHYKPSTGTNSNSIYVCNHPDCEAKLVTPLAVYRHQLRVHPKRLLSCDWPGCESQFKAMRYLIQHKNTIHLGLKLFQCEWPGCSYNGTTSENLKHHKMGIHTKVKTHVCDWPGCEYRASIKWALVAHKRTHTGEKPYACNWPGCTYRCTQPCTLISHKRKHTGEKPYVCPEKGCGKRFSSLAGIHTHRKQHNKQILRKSV